ncbi:MAG TPA: PAS domain S-box protein [Desulfotignum sp.]|nr:PAS domain S-box protein [Desulfotignum sp.]
MKSIIFDNSEMAMKIRKFDWSQTPVGSLENWPQSLQHHVNSLLANLFPAILFWGTNHTVCAYNDAYRPLLGTKPEALGRSFFEVWPEAVEIIKPKIYQALQGEACYYKDAPFTLLRFGKPDQAYFDYCYSPVRDEKGSIKGVLNTTVEVTERKLAEEALQENKAQFQDAFAYAPVGMVIADLEGCFLHVNDAYCRITGYSEQELLQSSFNFQQLTHPNDLGKNLEALRRLIAGEIPAFFYEKRYLRKDGTTAWVRASASLRRHPKGEDNEIVGVVEDITKRKKAEEALQTLNQTLEQKVAERTAKAEKRSRQLQSLTLALIEAEGRERERIAGLLHDDIQQDLTALKMMIEMMRSMEGGRRKSDISILRCRDILKELIQKSRKLCHDLNPPGLRSRGLLICLERLVNEMRENYGLDLELNHSPDAEPDSYSVASFLYQALKELLFNVVKHSGALTAQLNISEKDGWIVVKVADSGKGDDLDQVLARRGIEPGYGLFSIDERVRSLGGRMTIETIPGDGWVTTLTIPKAEAKGEDRPELKQTGQVVFRS